MVIVKDPTQNYLKQSFLITINKKIQVIPRMLLAQRMNQKDGKYIARPRQTSKRMRRGVECMRKEVIDGEMKFSLLSNILGIGNLFMCWLQIGHSPTD